MGIASNQIEVLSEGRNRSFGKVLKSIAKWSLFLGVPLLLAGAGGLALAGKNNMLSDGFFLQKKMPEFLTKRMRESSGSSNRFFSALRRSYDAFRKPTAEQMQKTKFREDVIKSGGRLVPGEKPGEEFMELGLAPNEGDV